jgi:hypothetical protein
MSYDASDQVNLTNALTNSIKVILESTDSKPSKLTATYEWVETDTSEELVPVINIQWFSDAGCVQK